MTNGRKLSWALNIVTAALCLASSGLDGVYLSAFMPLGWGWLGLAMNSAADVASQLLMTAWGHLRQGRKGSKKHKMAWLLLPVEALAIGFSWLLSWRQLLIVMPPIEGAATGWVSAAVAGFVPLLLAGIGVAQSLLYEKDEVLRVAPELAERALEPIKCQQCQREFGSQQALNGHKRWCAVHTKETADD